MDTMFLTYNYPRAFSNNKNKNNPTPFKEKSTSTFVFDSFTAAKKPEKKVEKPVTLIGAASGFGYSLYKTLNENNFLKNFEKYKKRALNRIKKEGQDISKITDDILKKEIKLAKENRKLTIPLSIIFWSGAGTLAGSLIGNFIDYFSER